MKDMFFPMIDDYSNLFYRTVLFEKTQTYYLNVARRVFRINGYPIYYNYFQHKSVNKISLNAFGLPSIDSNIHPESIRTDSNSISLILKEINLFEARKYLLPDKFVL